MFVRAWSLLCARVVCDGAGTAGGRGGPRAGHWGPQGLRGETYFKGQAGI